MKTQGTVAQLLPTAAFLISLSYRGCISCVVTLEEHNPDLKMEIYTHVSHEPSSSVGWIRRVSLSALSARHCSGVTFLETGKQ